MANKITPFLMFEGAAEEAMRLYISLFVECENEGELDSVFGQLSDGGEVMMPPDDYGCSKKFCRVSDRFGVSWQLNLQ